jgi:hypothetical protein
MGADARRARRAGEWERCERRERASAAEESAWADLEVCTWTCAIRVHTSRRAGGMAAGERRQSAGIPPLAEKTELKKPSERAL